MNEQVVETSETGTARIIRETDGTFTVQREFGGRWFSVIRDPKPFFADNRTNETPEESARYVLHSLTSI